MVVYERRHELIKYCNLIGLDVTSFSWISEQMNISTWSMREFNLVVGVGRGAGRAVTRYNTPDQGLFYWGGVGGVGGRFLGAPPKKLSFLGAPPQKLRFFWGAPQRPTPTPKTLK